MNGADMFQQAVGFHQQGDLSRAETLYRELLHAQPNNVDVLSNLGVLHFARRQFADAAACYHQALSIDATHVLAWNNLGNALKELGRADEAIACFQHALRLNPSYAEAHYNLGMSLYVQKQAAAAAGCFREALRLNPGFADAHNNLGLALIGQGALAQAIDCFREALRLAPQHTAACYNLGNALKDAGRVAAAIDCYRQAIHLNPHFADACNRLGIALMGQGQLDGGLACFQQALQIDPGHADALGNLAFALQYHPGYDAHALAAIQRDWFERHARHLAPTDHVFGNDTSPGRRLRIGYISPDFRDHVVGRNIWPLLRHHDHGQFEVTLYASVSAPDAVTEKFRAGADRWRDISCMTDELVAEQVRQDEIDILVDLALHTGGHRLLVFARKPAPVQVTFAGYPGGTGLNTIDYRLTDPYLDPPGLFDGCFAEAPVRLPHSFWCHDPEDELPPVAALPALASGRITFGCLNNPLKVNDQVLQLWAAVLHAVPRSQLLILAKEGGSLPQTLDYLVKQGIDAARITFAFFTDRTKYLQLYHQIDIGLDTIPYNGHTTSLDAFWMGVPVVTIVGRTIVGRAGLSQAANLGLEDLVAASPTQFVQLAANLAENLPRLQELRQTSRQRMKASPLMDAVGFARGIEQAYRIMWRQWCSQAPERVATSFAAALRYHQAGELALAAALYGKVLALQPAHVDAHNNLGNIFGQQGKFDEAAACFRRTLQVDPRHANAHYNLATALVGQERAEEAIPSFRQALSLDADRHDARAGLANALNSVGHARGRLGQYAEAAEYYRQALDVEAGHAMAQWNLALLRLQQGDFEGGWRYFHLRETLPGMVPRKFAQPRWDGTHLAGKTILVYAEKGLGDVLQMIRFLPVLQTLGGRVILECQPALVKFLTGAVGVDQLVAAGAALPPFDVAAPLFDLPSILGTTLATIPANVPYLSADPGLVEHWRAELARRVGAGLKVGVAWQGSLLLKDYERSTQVIHFEKLARIPGVHLISLQKGPGTEQLSALPRPFPILDLADKLDSEAAFLDTAAVIANLDLVVTVDTAIAHLAGALGRPVWTALEFAPDWRWLLQRSDSPWYPPMRLFRQLKPGDWSEVFERIAAELRRLTV